MSVKTVLHIPETVYQRLVNTAQATQQPIKEVILYALKVGSPPEWDDVPEEFQANLATLDKLNDETLWKIARSHQTTVEMERYNILLQKNQSSILSEAEQLELENLRYEADCFMLRKAQAAVLLRWRGHLIPIS